MTEFLNELENSCEFFSRHIGPNSIQQKKMLEKLGFKSLKEFIEDVIPKSIRLPSDLHICSSVTEISALKKIRDIANFNQVFKSYIGMGYANVHVPSVILRNILENPGWYTSYTPYQPEISQGRLETLLNFQQMTLDLTKLDIASASLLDEATAAAEAMLMCRRIVRNKKNNVFFISSDIHPQTIDVLKTRAETSNFTIVIDSHEKIFNYSGIFGVMLQQIGSTGQLHVDYPDLIKELKSRKVVISVIADLMSLLMLSPPKKNYVDIILGSAQKFGIPMGYGGPHAAFFATKNEYKRQMPGRIIGVSKDVTGNMALRMAMQTREQHIRRERANSNICTSQALLANIAGLYAIYHGPNGLRRIAKRINRLTNIMALGLKKKCYKLRFSYFFDTLCIETEKKFEILEQAKLAKVNLRSDIDGAIVISFDETKTSEDILQLFEIFFGKNHDLDVKTLDKTVSSKPLNIPLSMLRQDDILTHPVFNSYHNETEMMRYMHSLERKDLSLNTAMIPLGSCTMKLNSASEMLPLTWSEFSDMHPFCPQEQSKGYQKMIIQLKEWLMRITGYDGICIQPNSGAQGEYAGLVTIRRYQHSYGQGHRNICLIPSSAHGTNPASAHMAGMKISVISCNSQGDIDLKDLQLKIQQAGKYFSCMMITYPSTHGVYEEKITEICQYVHIAGGQVYLDGANMNAQVGITSPAYIGADIAHLNLHKTFCIPHGGGGPGMGPIGAKSHLVPFMPGHSVVQMKNMMLTNKYSAVSSSPFGSASILTISWMYIRMMGSKGLKLATEIAILNANYIANSLKKYYKLLYTCNKGYIAHECILDIRPIKKDVGITELDIAKRLIDYGFHAPTMSFPVPGTLMIEPTESESKIEIDRFINAMISIRKEITLIQEGYWPLKDNPLVNAPHIQEEINADSWDHCYSQKKAFFPSGNSKNKYWPTVKRLDDIYGERHLVCSCTTFSGE